MADRRRLLFADDSCHHARFCDRLVFNRPLSLHGGYRLGLASLSHKGAQGGLLDCSFDQTRAHGLMGVRLSSLRHEMSQVGRDDVEKAFGEGDVVC